MVLRVGGVRERVTDQIERNGDKAQNQGGVEQLVAQTGLHHHLAAVVDQIAQRGRIHREAQADVGDEHLVADGFRNGEGHAQHDHRHQIRQQVAQHDAHRGGADAAGGNVVVTVTDDEDLVADEPRHLDPALDGHAQDHGPDAGGGHIGDEDQHNGGGNVVKDVVQLREQKIQPAHIAPQHTGSDAHHGFDESHEKGNSQAGAGTGPDAGPQVLPDGVGTPDKAVLPGSDVAVLDAGDGVHGAEVGVCLPRQIRLEKSKGHHGHQRDEQGHGCLVLEESTEGAAPVAVVGAGRGLGLLGVEPGGGKQFVLRQVCPGSRAFLLQGVELVFQLFGFFPFQERKHQRPPSFLPKLMRGSMSTMSTSPRIRPTMPTQAYSSTMPCTMVLSWRCTQVTSSPPIPGMLYRLSM